MTWVYECPTEEGYYWVWSHHYPNILTIQRPRETNPDGPGFSDQDAWMKIEKPEFPEIKENK